MATKPRSKIHNFDIDDHLNRFVPRPRFYLLPKPVSYWFGYRAPPKDHAGGSPASPTPSVLLVWLFTFIGAFCGIAIIMNVVQRLPVYNGHHAPIFASFGAAAILEYNAIESPLSQPRNLILGHLFSAAIGVSITRLFELLPPERFLELQWLAGALAVAISGTVMSITKTVHPPAGATALLAVTNQQVMDLSWWALPLVLLAACLMLVSAMIINNLYKRFPIYWWTPVDLSKLAQSKNVTTKDVEKADIRARPSIQSTSDAGSNADSLPASVPSALSDTASTKLGDEEHEIITKKITVDSQNESKVTLEVNADHIVLPEGFELSSFEKEFLESLQQRLRSDVGR